jgi:hypothetical protein
MSATRATAVPPIELIRSVIALIGTARDDPRYREKAQGVLELCSTALEGIQAAQDEARADAPAPAARVAPTTGPGNLGLSIAELRAAGRGVREIARELGVNASTVSRQLRKASAKDVARNCAIPGETGR